MKGLLLISLLTLCGCTASKLEKALDYSRENRSELESVLRHYSQNDADSLKYKAAVFLIENMPGHYSLADRYYTEVDSLFPKLDAYVKNVLYCIPEFQSTISASDATEDIKIIKSDFLIQHIDRAFHVWKTVPWHKDISFDVFCRYLLPYRMGNEPLELLMKAQAELPIDSISSQLSGYNIPMNELRFTLHGNMLPSESRNYTLPDPIGEYKFECIGDAFLNLIQNRLTGVPTAIDYAPHWPNRNGRHYWNCIIDPYMKKVTTGENRTARHAKIYRKTYTHNDIPQNNGRDSIPILFQNPFNEDVTASYINVKDVKLNCSNLGREVQNVYLAVFNNLDWQPIAWSKAKRNGDVTFQDVGLGNVYQPVFYKEDQLLYADYPFILDVNGNSSKLIPDKQNKRQLVLTRKYPFDAHKLEWNMSLIGSEVGVSNDGGKSYQTVHTINSFPRLPYIAIDTHQKSRYWTITPFQDKYGCVAEIQFVSGDSLINIASAKVEVNQKYIRDIKVPMFKI